MFLQRHIIPFIYLIFSMIAILYFLATYYDGTDHVVKFPKGQMNG
jgi:hypothetical protein